MPRGIPKNKDDKTEDPRPEGETVVVEKSFLEDIRKRMDALEEDNTMLKQVADKARISDFYVRNKEKMPTQYKLRMIEDNEQEKVILGWKMTKDDVYIDGPRVVENQVIKLILEDGTQKDLTYRDFVRLYTTVQCSKIGERSEDGVLILKLEKNDTKKVYEIDVKYVN
jgi:hypothetical protein